MLTLMHRSVVSCKRPQNLPLHKFREISALNCFQQSLVCWSEHSSHSFEILVTTEEPGLLTFRGVRRLALLPIKYIDIILLEEKSSFAESQCYAMLFVYAACIIGDVFYFQQCLYIILVQF